MCIKKERKQTHVRVGEKYTSIYKKYKYNVCQNGHKTNIQDIMYLKYREKKKIHQILTTSLSVHTPPNKNLLY